MNDFFQQFGISTLVVILFTVLGRWLLEPWLKARVQAGVERELQERLAVHQLAVDKDLERFRAQLSDEADRLRSWLQREGADFAIYAQQRHAAMARLFEDFLRIEARVTDQSPLMFASASNLTETQIIAVMERLDADEVRSTTVLAKHRASDFDRADELLTEICEAYCRARIFKARNEAYDAYFRSALYLPEPVDTAALAVRDHFHMMTIPYIAESGSRELETTNNKTKLRFLMIELQNRAREDLSRSAVRN